MNVPAREGVNFAVNDCPGLIDGVVLPGIPPHPGTPS